jgi:hypothetical protein
MNPYWIVVGFSSVVQLSFFLRWLHRPLALQPERLSQLAGGLRRLWASAMGYF